MISEKSFLSTPGTSYEIALGISSKLLRLPFRQASFNSLRTSWRPIFSTFVFSSFIIIFGRAAFRCRKRWPVGSYDGGFASWSQTVRDAPNVRANAFQFPVSDSKSSWLAMESKGPEADVVIVSATFSVSLQHSWKKGYIYVGCKAVRSGNTFLFN